MATFGDLIDRVEKYYGSFHTGMDRTDILDIMRDVLRFDIATTVGGRYVEGSASLSVGGGAYVASGIYALPSAMQALDGTFTIDDILLDPSQVYTDPFTWLSEQPNPGSEGKPSAILYYGRELHFRPIPPAATGYTVVMYGRIFPFNDDASVTEATPVPFLDLEGILVAAALTLAGATDERPELVQTWQPIWQTRLNAMKSGDTYAVHKRARPRLF